MQILRAPAILFFLLSTALSLPAAHATASVRSVELTEFILWAADLGWGGLPEDAIAARRQWLDDRRQMTFQTAALTRHTQRETELQSELRSLQATVEFSGGQRQRSKTRLDIARISREIESIDVLKADILRALSRLEGRSPLNYSLPDEWMEIERAAARLGAHTPANTRKAQVATLGKRVAAELAELSLKSTLPLESWLEQRAMRARNVLLLTIAALQLTQQPAPSTLTRQIVHQLGDHAEPMLFWGGSVGAISGVLLAAGTGDWSHIWASIPLGAVTGSSPGLVLATAREFTGDSEAMASAQTELQTSKFLLKRFLRNAGFKSLVAFQQEFEMRFRHSDLGGCIAALSS